MATRLYWENRRGQGTTGRRVLVAGAGEAGSLIAGEMLRHPEAGLRPVGFLDDDPNKRGQTIKGVPVVGSLQDLPKAVRELAVEEVLIAMPSAPGSVVRQVVNLARLSRVPYRILPPSTRFSPVGWGFPRSVRFAWRTFCAGGLCGSTWKRSRAT